MIEPSRSGDRRCAGCGTRLAADNTARLCSKCHRDQHDQLGAPPAHLNDDFFETAEFRAAFGSQHIGKVLKAYRNHPRHLQLFGKPLNQQLLGRWLGLTQAQVSKLENGKREQNLATLQNYAKILHLPPRMLWFDLPGQTRLTESRQTSDIVLPKTSSSGSLEDLRTGLTDVLAAALVRDAGIDDLELQTLQLGKATRFRAPDSLVLELSANLDEIRRVIAHCPSEPLSRRLARIAAQLAGLMSLSLLKLDDRVGARNWVRTARLLASETNDPNLRAWVQAQEAYYHFYNRDYRGTIDAAQHAQLLESRRPDVGSALAAAIEARAFALSSQHQEAMRAIAKAETYLDGLPDDALIPSAFGYNAAQLTFHQGNTLKHLGEVDQALEVQDHALELFPQDDFMDRALVLLDKADCLAADGEISAAVELAIKTLSGLESSQAQGIITNRARQTLLALPPGEIRRPGVLELRNAIASLKKMREGNTTIDNEN